jgi:hypothetical protein
MGGYRYGVGGEIAGERTEITGLFIMVMTCSVLGIHEWLDVIAFGSYARSLRDKRWVWRYTLSITISFRI